MMQQKQLEKRQESLRLSLTRFSIATLRLYVWWIINRAKGEREKTKTGAINAVKSLENLQARGHVCIHEMH